MKNRKRAKVYTLIFFAIVFNWNNLTAQIVVEEEHHRLYYDYTARVKKFKDMEDFRDVFHYNKFLLGKKRIAGMISYNTGRVVVETPDHAKRNEWRNAIGFYFRYRFFEQFTLSATFYKDFNPEASARWISNYTYSLARYNWKPNKFSYGYENYVNNRYSDNMEEVGEKFLEGYYFISYSHNINSKKVKVDSTTNIKMTYFARYSIHYTDNNEVIHGAGELTSGKPSLGISMHYTLFRNIYVEGAAYYYFDPAFKKQQPWDPDYTYGFGYYDYRSFRCSITYGNWAVNRFPWNKTIYPYYGFWDGSFRFIVNWAW